MEQIDIIVKVIITLASLLTAAGVIFGVIKPLITVLKKWNGYDQQITDISNDIQTLRTEQYVQTRVMLATLDGLHQLGCNGKVTEATEELNDYINKLSHKQS